MLTHEVLRAERVASRVESPRLTLVTTPASPEAPASPIDDDSSFSKAYERQIEKIRGVPEGALATMNIDVQSAVATVLGCLPKLRALGSDFALLPNTGEHFIEELEDLAMATAQASSLFKIAVLPPNDLEGLYRDAVALRSTLRLDVQALVTRGLIARERLRSLKGRVGYQNVAFELMGFAALLREVWSTIAGKTAITPEDVGRATELGERLLISAARRKRAPEPRAEARRIRQQAFTLMVNAYDEARRAVAFLRWREKDAETFAPSLYAAKGKRSKGVMRDAELVSPVGEHEMMSAMGSHPSSRPNDRAEAFDLETFAALGRGTVPRGLFGGGTPTPSGAARGARR